MDGIHVTSSTTAMATIEKLRVTFATHGIPVTVVTDNGTNFTSREFENFMKSNGIAHVKTAPYHPASNGLAEKAVQTFKAAMKRLSGSSVETKVSKFLYKYRITPQTTTGTSPAELLMGRRLRTHLDLLYPDLDAKVRIKQLKQKAAHDGSAQDRIFEVGDKVYVLNFLLGPQWLPGVIMQSTGPVSFQVMLQDGRLVRRHQDHVRRRFVGVGEEDAHVRGDAATPWDDLHVREAPAATWEDLRVGESPQGIRTAATEEKTSDSPTPHSPAAASSHSEAEDAGATEEPHLLPTLRRSSRIRKAPDRLQLCIM